MKKSYNTRVAAKLGAGAVASKSSEKVSLCHKSVTTA